MQLTFLGTSAGWPLPRLGCTCEICSSRDPKDHRLRPALLVNESILLDAPVDIYHELQTTSHKPSAIRYILLTHTHPDHIIGLYDLSHIYGKDEKPTIITTEGVLKEVRRNFGVPLGGAFQTKIVKPQEEFQLNEIKAWYIPVEHGVMEAYGIKLKDRPPTQAGKIIFYAPEFRKILPSLRRTIRGADLIILDGSSLGKPGQTKGHENIEEGIRLAKDLRAKRVLFTNIGHKTLTHEKLEEFVKTYGGSTFGITYDGLQLEV